MSLDGSWCQGLLIAIRKAPQQVRWQRLPPPPPPPPPPPARHPLLDWRSPGAQKVLLAQAVAPPKAAGCCGCCWHHVHPPEATVCGQAGGASTRHRGRHRRRPVGTGGGAKPGRHGAQHVEGPTGRNGLLCVRQAAGNRVEEIGRRCEHTESSRPGTQSWGAARLQATHLQGASQCTARPCN